MISSLLDSPFLKANQKFIGMKFSKQQELEVDLKGIKQINFPENLGQGENTTFHFILEELKENVIRFFTRNEL